MRHSTHDCGVIYDENDNLVGVNLGWDFVSEHEWGIKNTSHILGIKGEGDGPDRHLVNNVSSIQSTTVTINKVKWHMIFCHEYRDLKSAKTSLPGWFNEDSTAIAAWSDGGFVVGIRDKKVHDAILDALTNDDAIVTLEQLFAKESNPFSNSGLKILIRSAIPQKWEEDWIAAHEDNRKLLAASDATGIKAKLKENGRGFYALSPRWISDIKKAKSKYDVVYWLNPAEQQKYNFGWFTVEDLEQWAEGTGPIMMEKA